MKDLRSKSFFAIIILLMVFKDDIMNKTKIFDGIIVFIIAVAILFFVSPVLAANMGIMGVALPEILIAMIAIAAVLIRKDDVTQRLSLRFPTIKSFFGAVVLMFGATAWQNAVSMIFVSLTGYTSETDITFFESYFDKASPFVILIVVALIPAICEELFFRGYLLNCFKSKKHAPAIIITALLFASMHLDIYKFFPLIIMAWAYGFIAAKTKSVVLPIIFHFLNNALAVISFYTIKNSPEEKSMALMLSEKTYIGYSVAAIGVGLALVYLGSKMLSGKKNTKRTTLITLITAGAAFTLGVAMMMTNMVYVPYEGEYKAQIRTDTEYTESFTLKAEAYTSIDASIRSNKELDCNIVITDSSNIVVYDHTDKNSSSDIIHLYPDEYTVTYSFNVDEDESLSYDVYATLKVNCLSLSQDQDEVSDETEEVYSEQNESSETSEIGKEAI